MIARVVHDEVDVSGLLYGKRTGVEEKYRRMAMIRVRRGSAEISSKELSKVIEMSVQSRHQQK
jgi:hypothetical protein